MQKVQATLLPFHLHRKTIDVPHGLTIQQMVDFTIKSRKPAPLPDDARFNFDMKMFGNRRERRRNWLKVIVTINGYQIPEENWSQVRPKPSALVGLNVVAGKGGKNPLATILSLALLVAAPYIAGAATASFIGATGITSLTAAQAVYGAVRIGVGVVGFLATSMLSSTPSQRSFKNPTESPTMFIEGASNDVLKYGVIPVNLGTNRMFPPQAALPYTETVSNLQYARQLFTWGYSASYGLIVANKRIGETAVSAYKDILIKDRLLGDLNQGIDLYSIDNDIYQDGYSILLKQVDGFSVRTTQPNTSEVSIDLTFVGGLTKYSGAGKRLVREVEFNIQYAPTGTSSGSSLWSTGVSGKSFTAKSKVAPNPARGVVRKNILILKIADASLDILTYNSPTIDPTTQTGMNKHTDTVPPIPDGYIRIASFDTQTATISPYAAEIVNFVDERAPYIPTTIADSGSFVPSFTGMTVNTTDGTFTSEKFIVSAATAEGLRVSKSFVLPFAGQYDVRIQRVTDDSTDDKIRDECTWTSMRSIAHRNPVNQNDICGTGVRILATDQLNGTVDRFNGDVTTLALDYFSSVDEWLAGPTSNPASIYRYVLQSPAFVKRLSDDRINLTKLEEWHEFCAANNLTYDRVIDYETSIDDTLNDIAAAGLATPHKVDGVYSVIIDNERPTIKGMVNPRNSWGYSGNLNYPDMPHALRVEFRNKDKGYALDEAIVYMDGYGPLNATLYERLSYPSCTNYALAVFYGRRYMANALLQPETHKWNMDFENLTFNRGDRITFVNDVLLVGSGSGRIKSIILDPMDATKIKGFVLDEVISIPNANQFGVRVRHADATGFNYYPLTTVIGETDTFYFTTEVSYDEIADAEKWLTSLCSFSEFGKELDLVVTDIKGNPDQSASITAINYAPERFNSNNAPIPPFVSNITVPLDLQAPLPPEIGGAIRSDESVMNKNSDGSYTGRMIIPLSNPNEPSVVPVIRIRPSGATVWGNPDVLMSNPSQVILTGLEDGSLYDIEIRYQRPGGKQLMSVPLQYNGVEYVGASTKPTQVQNFIGTTTADTILLSWTKNPEIDIAYYTVTYSSLFVGATYATAQLVAEKVYDNRLSLPYQNGTYFIKAVDILGNESDTASSYTTFNSSILKNVVQTLVEEPTFTGTKDNTFVSGGKLVLNDLSLGVGYYYFSSNVDVTSIYDCILSAAVVANGVFRNNIFDMSDVFLIDDIFGSGDNDVFAMPDIFAEDDMFGIGADAWAVTLQFRVSQDGVTFGSWMDFVAGHVTGRIFEFRIKLESFTTNVSPSVSKLEVTVDMPDRVERGVNIACSASTGATITYPSAFKNNPAVIITVQNGATDDRLDYISKDATGFQVKVWNAAAAAYVTRTLDYVSSGYGRVQT